MCENSISGLFEYCQTMSKLIRKGELPYTPQIVHEIVPQWTEAQRLAQERKFSRGTVDVFTPPTMLTGAHLLKVSSSRILFGGFHASNFTQSADMAEAENFASQNWAENMLNEHPAEALLCTVIKPGISRDDWSKNIPLLILLDCKLADIECDAFRNNRALQDCLKDHVQRYTTCEVGIQEFNKACDSKSLRLNVQHFEVCGGCGRHVDMCNCFKPLSCSASSLFAVPYDIMTALTSKSDVSMMV